LIICVLGGLSAQAGAAATVKMTASKVIPAAAAAKLHKQEQSRFRTELNEAMPLPRPAKGERMGFPVFRPENHFFILLYIQPKIII
jgi:hypothetical protein